MSSLEQRYLKVPNPYKKYVNAVVKRKNIKVKISTLKSDNVFVKFSYKHNNKATLGAEFNIAILPIAPFFNNYKSRYKVNIKQKAIELKYDNERISLGTGLEREIEISKYKQEIEMSETDQLIILPSSQAFNDDDELLFFIKVYEKKIPFLLTSDVPVTTPISGDRIRNLIRVNQKSMEWNREDNRLLLNNEDFYLHSDYAMFFEWEDMIVNNGIKYATLESGQIYDEDIELSDDLNEAYSRLLTYFQGKKTIPSLCIVTDQLQERAIVYINQYIKEIESFEDGKPAGRKGVDLFKLGTIKAREKIYLTPFHPLMIAYKIKYFETLGTERLGNNILNRLSPEGLLPFIYDNNKKLYKPEYNYTLTDWLVFKPVEQVSVTDSSNYLSKIVRDKIVQFKTHFSYLFMENSQAPLKINIVNISNDLEVIKGIITSMVEALNKKTLIPIEITLYNSSSQEESALEKLFRLEDTLEFKRQFDTSLKVKELEENDVLRIIRENISFYKSELTENINYAHLTFYNMEENEEIAIQPMDNMISGIAIEGLYSNIPSMKDEATYRSGFGVKSYNINSDNLLTKLAYYLNELAANLRNNGNDSYRKGLAIYSCATYTDEKELQKILDSSHWVTFVDPSIDLEYFNKFNDDLVVIHYSDQYSSSSRYDAITVTNKSNQYFAVIKEFLEQKEINNNIENVRNAVKAFNVFNGEWLLRIIGSQGYQTKEKLSIISAIKFAVSYLDHPNILWVPVSLEEILRVAGAVNLNKTDGVFTAKNLGVKGVHSDDLLLIGLENNEKDEVILYFYPVEVKIGINSNLTLEKARKQVIKTKNLIIDSLTGEKGNTFEGKFYRNFFVQLFIANARKLYYNDFWLEKNYKLADETVERLLKDDFKISNELVRFIGEGAILSFQKDAYHRSAFLENDVLLLNLIEYDGFNGLIQPIEEMRHWIQEETNDLIKEDMLSYKYRNDKFEVSRPEENNFINIEEVRNKTYDIENNSRENISIQKEEKKEISSGIVNQTYKKISVDKEPEPTTVLTKEKTSLENIRFLIGTAENSNKKIYWEYGHGDLGNRHLLISGKSGQGKTYFMQCLLLEASKSGISNIVIDYTGGFLPAQLEPEFVGYLGDKITQKVVYNDGFPINPFRRNSRDIEGIMLQENEIDVAERIKSVFAAVYSRLGIQQLNAIYDASKKGVLHFDDQMDLEKLKDILEKENSSYTKTALSQIRPLIDRNPFDTKNTIDWKDIIDSDGEVFIIQLAGFNRDVQLIITEFILWDLWNYTETNGNKYTPIPVILDEAQNLDFSENAPSARILQEGRKFGWSAWYATQFLKAQLNADELARLQNSSQKVYFLPPDEEIGNIASNLSKDPHERKEWERKLASLKKGQCIVHGPVLLPNGTLSRSTVNIVNITSLQERI